MRKLLTAIGALTMIIILAAGTGLGVLIYKGNGLDRESKTYVDTAIPAIVGTWSKQALLDRATPELRATATPQDLASLFDWASKLGPFVAYEGASGDANMQFMAGSGSAVSAHYAARVRFRDGTAIIYIMLLKRDGDWRINGFHIEPALTQGTDGKA
jgi:hypothetical protein